jgi:hypothetical protein
MPIKKRSNRTVTETDEQPAKLVIEAAEKKPMPNNGRLAAVLGDSPKPAQVRRLGAVAAQVHNPPDLAFTVDDRVMAMRTPYDQKNNSEVRYRNRVRNRATGITAMCVACQGGIKAVRECISTDCPLWAFRLGGDPFYGKRK